MNPDLTLFRRLDVLEFYVKAVRCFFVACLYFSNGKYRESVSLLHYDVELFKTALRKFQEIKTTVLFYFEIIVWKNRSRSLV